MSSSGDTNQWSASGQFESVTPSYHNCNLWSQLATPSASGIPHSIRAPNSFLSKAPESKNTHFFPHQTLRQEAEIPPPAPTPTNTPTRSSFSLILPSVDQLPGLCCTSQYLVQSLVCLSLPIFRISGLVLITHYVVETTSA